MMFGNFALFDIQIGDTLFSKVKLKEGNGTLRDLVKRIIINKNLDKTLTKGKKRIKINTCDVVLSNPVVNGVGQLDNILRLGRKVQVWLGYEGYPLTRVGVYTLYNPVWKYPQNGVPEVHFKAKAGDVGLMFGYGAKVYKNRKHSDVIREIAEEKGMAVDVLDSKEKTTLIKSVHENEYEAIQRWAYDIGYDFYVDSDTDPNTLVCKPVNDTEPTVIGGQRFTTGWGPDTKATFPAVEMTFQHNYPDPTLTMGARTDTAKVFGAGQSTFGYLGDIKKATEYMLSKQPAGPLQSTMQLETLSRGTATLGQLSQKLQGSQAAQQLSKTVEALYIPGIPFFRLGTTFQVVGHGDNSRKYRIVDITHEVDEKGFRTRIKAAIGGGPAAAASAGNSPVFGHGQWSFGQLGGVKKTPGVP